MTKYAIIIEPYLSGGLLPAAFREHGVESFAVHMRPPVGKVAASFNSAEFARSVVFDGDIENLRRTIGDIEIVAVVPGQEAGVELADRLADICGLARNDLALSTARRDKYLMHQRIEAARLRAIKQTKSADLAEFITWIESNDCWPVVVKPVNSGGTDGVRICYDRREVRQAFEAAINKVNLLGFVNESMLAQELIAGTEYIVDTVSCQSHHHIVNIAQYEKEISQGGAPIYRSIRFIDPSQWADYAELIEYTFDVLRALGIVVGPAHSELFMDERGTVLVETGARLCGALVPKYLDEISTISTLDLTVLSYINPELFAIKAKESQRHKASLYAYFMRTGQVGVLKDRPGDLLIRKLNTFRDIRWFPQIGANIIPTQDLMSSLGMVMLLSTEESEIKKDLSKLRVWEDSEMLISV